jgi:hypothetical protein
MGPAIDLAAAPGYAHRASTPPADSQPPTAARAPRVPGRSAQRLSSAAPLAGDPDAMSEPQFGVHPRSAIHPTVAVMDLADALKQPRIAELPIRRRPTSPRLIPGSRDPEDLAHQGDRMIGLLRLDEPELAHRISSRAKKAAAFRRISPCSNRLTRPRSSRSSSRSLEVSPSSRSQGGSTCPRKRAKPDPGRLRVLRLGAGSDPPRLTACSR